MMRLASRISLGAAALLISASLAMAQTAQPSPPPAAMPKAPPAAAPKAPPAAAPKAAAKSESKGVPKKATTPEGVVCSKQADDKKLHGKERRTFRAKCIRDLKKAAAPAKAAPAKKN
jgi:hypothetical protein